jgi:prepilin-type N-terminal cleavage/methylation domain-containing protein
MCPCGAPERARRGFTLIETLAALVVVGFVAILAVGAFGDGLRAQRSTRRHAEGVALADLRLSELAASPVDSLLDGGDRAGAFPAPYAGFRWRTAVRRSPESPALLDVSVRVTWDGGAYDLATVLYRPEAELGGRP